jgi:hypothetical protein
MNKINTLNIQQLRSLIDYLSNDDIVQDMIDEWFEVTMPTQVSKINPPTIMIPTQSPKINPPTVMIPAQSPKINPPTVMIPAQSPKINPPTIMIPTQAPKINPPTIMIPTQNPKFRPPTVILPPILPGANSSVLNGMRPSIVPIMPPSPSQVMAMYNPVIPPKTKVEKKYDYFDEYSNMKPGADVHIPKINNFNIDPTDFGAPPEFMPDAIYDCEGYWDHDDYDDYEKKYQPIISNKVWNGKAEWIRKAKLVEEQTPFIGYRGMSPSRIDGTFVGSQEFFDTINRICWPQNYVQHYIEKYNVMPTRRFYAYINKRYQLLTQQK